MQHGAAYIGTKLMSKTVRKTKQVDGTAIEMTQYWRVLAPKGKLHEGTKFGAEQMADKALTFDGKTVELPSGTNGTHQALAWAAGIHGGYLSEAQGRAICAARGDKGFWNYAQKKLRCVVPYNPIE